MGIQINMHVRAGTGCGLFLSVSRSINNHSAEQKQTRHHKVKRPPLCLCSLGRCRVKLKPHEHCWHLLHCSVQLVSVLAYYKASQNH